MVARITPALLEVGCDLLGWSLETSADRERFAADLALLQEVHQLTRLDAAVARGTDNAERTDEDESTSRCGDGAGATAQVPEWF